jgi:hypothetical protein
MTTAYRYGSGILVVLGMLTSASVIAACDSGCDTTVTAFATSVTTAQTFSYTAQAVVPGSTPDSSVCNLLDARSQRSELRYEP